MSTANDTGTPDELLTMLGELPGRIQPTCSGGLINCLYGIQVGAEFYGDL